MHQALELTHDIYNMNLASHFILTIDYTIYRRKYRKDMADSRTFSQNALGDNAKVFLGNNHVTVNASMFEWMLCKTTVS